MKARVLAVEGMFELTKIALYSYSRRAIFGHRERMLLPNICCVHSREQINAAAPASDLPSPGATLYLPQFFHLSAGSVIDCTFYTLELPVSAP